MNGAESSLFPFIVKKKKKKYSSYNDPMLS